METEEVMRGRHGRIRPVLRNGINIAQRRFIVWAIASSPGISGSRKQLAQMARSPGIEPGTRPSESRMISVSPRARKARRIPAWIVVGKSGSIWFDISLLFD